MNRNYWAEDCCSAHEDEQKAIERDFDVTTIKNTALGVSIAAAILVATGLWCLSQYA